VGRLWAVHRSEACAVCQGGDSYYLGRILSLCGILHAQRQARKKAGIASWRIGVGLSKVLNINHSPSKCRIILIAFKRHSTFLIMRNPLTSNISNLILIIIILTFIIRV
jgi:hypothetical protein